MFVVYHFSEELVKEYSFDSYEQAYRYFELGKYLIKNHYITLNDQCFQVEQKKETLEVSYQGCLVQILGVRQI